MRRNHQIMRSWGLPHAETVIVARLTGIRAPRSVGATPGRGRFVSHRIPSVLLTHPFLRVILKPAGSFYSSMLQRCAAIIITGAAAWPLGGAGGTGGNDGGSFRSP